MDKGRVLMMIGLIAVAVCIASAQTAGGETPNTYVDHSNGVETSIPGTTVPLPTQSQPRVDQPRTDQPLPQQPLPAQPLPHQAQPVPNYLYTNGGNVALQNEAGSIYTRSDGRTVLVGAGGQTLVTNGDDSDEDDVSDETYSGYGGSSHNNVIINGQRGGGQSFISNNGGGVLINQAGEGSYQTFNNHQIHIIDGALQLTTGGKVYTFPAKGPEVNSQDKIDINGQEAVVQYENGNIVVELADGTVLAKADGGLFSGNRQSYVNRKQIQEDAARDAIKAQEHVSILQRQLHEQLNAQMKKLQEDLQRTLGNLRF